MVFPREGHTSCGSERIYDFHMLCKESKVQFLLSTKCYESKRCASSRRVCHIFKMSESLSLCEEFMRARRRNDGCVLVRTAMRTAVKTILQRMTYFASSSRCLCTVGGWLYDLQAGLPYKYERTLKILVILKEIDVDVKVVRGAINLRTHTGVLSRQLFDYECVTELRFTAA